MKTSGYKKDYCLKVITTAVMRAAGFDSERLTAYSLRHTAITQALLVGSPLQEDQHYADIRSQPGSFTEFL
jgi:hypothetical protein